MKKSMIIPCACAALLAGAAAATDGTLYEGGLYCETTWNSKLIWVHDTVAQDGGVATILAKDFTRDGKNVFNQNITGLTLSGIDFGGLTSTLQGSAITLVGTDPFLSSTAATGANVTLALKGEGGTLHKTGTGHFTLATPVSNFASVRVEDGTLATSGARLAEDATPVTLMGGATLAPAATVALDDLAVTGGVARATVASGATLTASSLACDAGGALLLNGAGAVKVTGQADAALSPRAVFIASDATNVAFAAESAADGFTRAADDAAGLLTIDAATTLADATSATAVQVRNRAALTVNNTLAVGDGAHPGRLLFTRQNAGGADETVSGTGEIAFGAQPGLVLRAVPTGGNTFTWNVRTTGSAGVQFASIATNGQSTTAFTFPNDYVAAWTGGTRFSGVSATITNTMFDAAGDIFVDGNDTAGAALTLRGGTYASRFHLAGKGVGSKTTLSTVQDKSVTLAGDVDVTGDVTAYLYGWYDSQKFIWAAPITGSGALTLQGIKEFHTFCFNATNTYAGATTLTGAGYTIVTNGTTLGAGPIAVGASCTLCYDGVPGLALTNTLSGAGRLTLQNTTATLDGGVIGTLRVAKNSTATLAGDLTAKNAELDAGTTLQAAAGATPTLTLTVAAGTTNALTGGTVQDGAGTLALVKTGEGHLDLGGARAYTGGTRLDAGTLRLVGGLTNGADVAFWLDASKPETVTTASDGSVSAWRSCGADGVSFGSYTAGDAADYGLPSAHDAEANRINGLPTVTFSAYGATDGTGKEASRAASRLVANKTTSQRTVFMVCRPRMTSAQTGNSGAWGATGRDLGQRIDRNGGWFTVDNNGASYNQGSGSVRQNGTSASTKNNEPQVMTFLHTRELIGGQYSSYSDFRVQLGGYAIWDTAARGYLSFNGDIAEVIAFTRVLSEAEIRAVENYLGQKWLGKTFHADGLDGAMRTANVLAPMGGLEIRAGATLDLNGVDQTVASLSGQGTIVNTGARAATLTVTGAWSFNGTIGAGVTVRAAGGETAATANVFVEKGGTLEVAGGTLAVKTFNPAPVTDGLTIWLDASKSETLALDANNAVTGWVSRLPATTRFTWNTSKKIWGNSLLAPMNAPTAWLGAKPCVDVPGGSGALWAETDAVGRTVFLMVRLANTWSGGYVWGPSDDDRGVRVWSDGIKAFGRYSLLHGGEAAWLNGTRYAYEETGSTIAYAKVNEPFCFAGRMDDTRGGTIGRAQWVLGRYANAGAHVYVAEVLAYDRRLTDAEVTQVNDYLMRKWITSGTTWPEENTSAFDAEGALAVSGAGTVDLGGADVTVGSLTAAGGTLANVGTLTLDGDLIVPVAADGSVSALTINGNVAFGSSARAVIDDYTKLDRTHRYKALQATGTVTGALSRSNLPAAYSWGPAKGPIWYVLYRAGTFLFLR